MEITATQKFIRSSPRKLTMVAHTIKGLSLSAATDALSFSKRRGATVLLKTLRQAVANAVNNARQEEGTLAIKSIQVLPGPTYKRWRAVSRGRAHAILRRTSHIKVILESKDKPEVISPVAPQPTPKLKKQASKPKKVSSKKKHH